MITYILDCGGFKTPKQLHHALALRLSFPVWYGHNLDALFDMLTNVSKPTKLILLNYDSSALSSGFKAVLEDAAAENPAFTYEVQ